MRRLALAPAAIAVAAACTTDVVPIEPPVGPSSPVTYDVTLTVDSVSSYAPLDPRCVNSPNQFYCWVYIAKPSIESAVLELRPRDQGLPGDTAILNGNRFGIALMDSLGRQVVKLAPFPIYDPARGSIYDFYTLTGLATDGVFDGTWMDETDPHGANRMGTFHAVRRSK